MKVLLSAFACAPRAGSEEGAAWNWAQALAGAGHDVTVLTQSLARDAIEDARTAVGGRLRFEYVVARPSPVAPFGYYGKYLAWQWAAYRAARGRRRNGFDVVHHVSLGSVHGGSHLWRLGVPFVFGPVGGGHEVPTALRSELRGGRAYNALRGLALRSIRFNPLAVATVRHAAVVLATNSDTLALVRAMGAGDARLFLDSGVPEALLERSSTPAAAPQLRVLWVGRLMPHKGLRLALSALDRARQRIPVRLVIAGDGPLRDDMVRWITELRLHGHVEWKGLVPLADLYRLYEGSDALLFTSLRDSFGGQLLEGMALGVPLVVLDHQGARDFVPSDAACKVAPGRFDDVVEGLADALCALHAAPARRHAMAEAGRVFAQEHTWSAKAAAVSPIYESVVRDARR